MQMKSIAFPYYHAGRTFSASRAHELGALMSSCSVHRELYSSIGASDCGPRPPNRSSTSGTKTASLAQVAWVRRRDRIHGVLSSQEGRLR